MKLLALAGLAVSLAFTAAGFWIPAKALVAQQLLEHAWAQERAGSGDAKPWPWADTSPIARLEIPSVGRDWIVLSGASGRNLAFAPSHMNGSALPGERGVTVIAGHRDTHFSVLAGVATGDEIVLERGDGSTVRYWITGTEIVDSTHAALKLDADLPMLVLVTCYPFDALTAGGPLRYVVTAVEAT
ncbi:MAG: class GN sortase [Gammaproteobacteria bacterium]|nr:class GN sortase [Gammaproteobacteria bacterium]